MTNIVMIYPDLTPTCRLCGIEQLTFLQNQGENINFRHYHINHISPKTMAAADIVFLVRSDTIIEQEIARKLKKAGKYLIYILDDDLLSVPKTLVNGAYYNREEIIKNIKNCMGFCNCLCSPSPMILKKYGNAFEKLVLIEEPCIQTTDFKSHDINNPIKIGFAGSIDRENDIDTIISEALIELKTKYNEKIVFEFFGVRPNRIPKEKYSFYPFEKDYDSYKKKLTDLSWDIGLAPMPDTPFHHCKHYNKFIEYSGNDIVGVYSNNLPYTRVIINGENGLLCDNSKKAWVNGLSQLIDNSNELEKIKTTIRNTKEEKFSIDVVSDHFKESFAEIFTYLAPKRGYFWIVSLYFQLIILKFYMWMKQIQERCYRIITINKWETPIYLIKKVFFKIRGL